MGALPFEVAGINHAQDGRLDGLTLFGLGGAVNKLQ
jgi:hypothetical protein